MLSLPDKAISGTANALLMVKNKDSKAEKENEMMGSSLIQTNIGRTQLLFATGIEGGIHDPQVLKYQPPGTSRVIFHHLIPLIIIDY